VLWRAAHKTYVATWSGFAYAYFITDAFSRMIVGWRVASHMRGDMVLDALEMARWRRGTFLEGLVSHSDAGSQFTSIRYGEHLDELRAVPSIGSVGDAYDNALAESIKPPTRASSSEDRDRGPGATSTTSSWPHSPGSTGTTRRGCTSTSVTCHQLNSRRLMLPTRPTNNWLESNSPSLHQTQDGSLGPIDQLVHLATGRSHLDARELVLGSVERHRRVRRLVGVDADHRGLTARLGARGC
jgi:Integrase core domain